MAKRLKIALMIFALGIFIVPKQMIFAQETEMSCCNKTSSKKECCQKENSKPCHDSKNQKNSCEGNCAKCASCSFTTVFIATEFKNISVEGSENFISNKVENFYLTPYFSKLYSAIWQPPKIS